MHIHFEKTRHVQSDSWILSLSWMGKVPEELPEEEGWKLNRTNYYQEGWLATGNMRGILGVTYTTAQWKDDPQHPARTNFNLRGHRSQITLVQWNEPYQKLASCDSSGIIFVWIKFEGRWSIELINDRSTPVTHFSWSHDGRMALICYQDGFVLVGSVAGQRYWSSMLNIDSTITAGTWTPDDQQVYFGTSNGQLIVMDVQGMMVSQIQLPVDSPIIYLSWNCEKFKMEESEEGELWSGTKRPLVLAVAFKNGLIYMMHGHDDLAPAHIYTGMQGLFMEWSNSGEYLAVSGSRPVEVMTSTGIRHHEYFNSLHFYSPNATRVSNLTIPATESPVTSLCFGHNDKRIFVATGKELHVGWVSKRVATLQLLCRLMIYKSLSTATCVGHLPLPLPVRALISSLHTQTVISNLPSAHELRHFSIHPQPNNQRLYCTMVRHQEDLTQTPGTVYTLYIENLGGVVPILKGKRISKLRPEFIVYDPEVTEIVTISSPMPLEDPPSSTPVSSRPSTPKLGHRTCRGKPLKPKLGNGSGSSDSEDVELCASPRMSRKRHRNRLRERAREEEREREEDWERNRKGLLPRPEHQLNYNDTLPEALKIAEISSNIWGTKFKIRGLVPFLPEALGQVTYRTSVLHLQPRQMTIRLTELRDENDIFFFPTDPLFLQDEDDEDDLVVMGGGSSDSFSYAHPSDYYTPPMPIRCLLQPHAQTSVGSTIEARAPVSTESPSMSSAFPCQACEASLASSSRSGSETPRHNSLQRLKSSSPFITARAHIERIEERTVLNSPPSSYSLNRRAGSIRSPTRRCWTGTEESAQLVTVAPPVVTAPIHVRRSMSASYLDSVYQLPLPLDIAGEEGQGGSTPRRLILIKGRPERKKCLGETGKSKSWDSYDLNWWKKGGTVTEHGRESVKHCPKCTFPTVATNTVTSPIHTSFRRRSQRTTVEAVEDKIEREPADIPRNSLRIPDPPPAPTHRRSVSLLTPLLRRREKSKQRGNPEEETDSLPLIKSSKGATAAPKTNKGYLSTASSPLRQLFANSPLLSRRKKRQTETYLESSDDDDSSDGSSRFVRPHSSPCASSTRMSSPSRFSRSKEMPLLAKEKHQARMLGKKKIHDIGSSRTVRRRREFIMSNKAPMWNENSQVYQLDFGGRVTQESAKNFQIEYRGKQVMQFGRIDGNAYTLDFQYPFSALQAFAVALANVTQRLK